jgi:hypothetical protein
MDICKNLETNMMIMSIEKIKNVLMERYINVLHVVIIAPMIGYIGYLAFKNKPIKFGVYLIVLAIFMAIYHVSKILDFAKNIEITPSSTPTTSTTIPSSTIPSSTTSVPEKENYENNVSLETNCLEIFMNGYNNETNKEQFRSESFTIRNNGESIDERIEDGKLYFPCSNDFNIYMDIDQEGQTVTKYTDLSLGQCYNKLDEQVNNNAKGIVYYPNTKECSTIKDRIHPKTPLGLWNFIGGTKPFYKNLNSILVLKNKK